MAPEIIIVIGEPGNKYQLAGPERVSRFKSGSRRWKVGSKPSITFGLNTQK